jgi:FkbM family methyltransferase
MSSIDQILRTALERKSRSVLVRSIAEPVAIYWPQLLRVFGHVLHTEAMTFFGRSMRIVLPEVVSTHIYRNGFFEADVCRYMMATLRPGGKFMDIGGHFGFFSMLGQELVGSDGLVITFEPMPATREILERNMRRNPLAHQWRLIPAAAGAETGELVFKDFGLVGSAYATSEQTRSDKYDVERTIEVAVRTIDSVVDEFELDKLDLVKIDAENAEDQVLAGAVATLAGLKPSLIIETGDMEGSSTTPILRELEAHGYNPFDLEGQRLRRHNIEETYTYGNLLLVHKDRLDELQLP